MSRSIWKRFYQHLNVDKAAFPNGSRGEDTVKAKQKHKVSHFISNFVKKKKEFRTYLVYFHTFFYKFKVQRIPTEYGPPMKRYGSS